MYTINFIIRMSSEEDDYMSDAFLAKLDDKRPGLITGKKAEKLMREEKIRLKAYLEHKIPAEVLVEGSHTIGYCAI